MLALWDAAVRSCWYLPACACHLLSARWEVVGDSATLLYMWVEVVGCRDGRKCEVERGLGWKRRMTAKHTLKACWYDIPTPEHGMLHQGLG